MNPVTPSSQTAPAGTCPKAWWAQPLAAFTASFLFLLVFVLNPRISPMPFEADTLWHVAAGQWMLDHGEILTRDVFSHTHADQPWLSYEWLSEIVMAAVYRLGGWDGLFLLCALAFAAVIALLGAYLQRQLAPYFVLIFLMLALYMGLHHFRVRPHVLAWPLLVLWTSNLTAAVDRDRAPGYWNLPLMTLWANMHGGFVVGIGMLGLLMLEAVVPKLIAGRWREPVVRQWLLFAGGAFLASLLTPHGLELYFHIARTLSDPVQMTYTQEWQPWGYISFFNGMGIWLMLVIAAGLLQGFRFPPLRAFTFLVLVYESLRHLRNINIAAFLAPIVLARPLGRHWANRRLNGIDRYVHAVRPEARNAALAAALALMVSAGALHHVLRPTVPAEEITARAAIDAAVAGGLTGPVFNSYNLGGALIFRGIKTWIDGRGDMFGGQALQAWAKIYFMNDLDAVNAFTSGCAAAWTLLPVDNALAIHLDGAPGWRRFYRDERNTIHVNAHCAAPGRS